VVLKGEAHLTSNQQFTRVYQQGGSWVDRLLVLRAVPNQLELTRYGFSISKQLGKAVGRNRLKRLLREILRLASLKPGWDIVFIARRPAADAQYAELETAVKRLLSRAGILAE
jgi:ribonuclease P protein component